MKNTMNVHVTLRLSTEDHALLKARAATKGISCNAYLLDLIHADAARNQSTFFPEEVEKILNELKRDCTDLQIYSYVILKLATANLSFNYHRDPSDEGIQNTLRFVEKKLEEAKLNASRTGESKY